MIGVHSWWSAPAGVPNFNTTQLARLSLAVNRRWFSKFVFVTDEAGERWAREYELPYDEILVRLGWIPSKCTPTWAIGKLATILEMQEPFIAVDMDVLAWKGLPDRITSAPVCAEWRENVKLAFLNSVFRKAGLPFEGVSLEMFNCGICGGHDLELLHRWARNGIDLTIACDGFRETYRLAHHAPSLVIEQVTLRQFAPSAEILFQQFGQINLPEARALNYTHLYGVFKNDPKTLKEIHRRVAENDLEMCARR